MSQLTTHLADFNGFPLEIVDHNGQQWLTSEQVGKALDLKHPRQAITKIYNRHSDEFNQSMVAEVDMVSPSGTQQTRIFSPRGAHLLAMWSQTDRAKTFRVWLLDVLESEQKAINQPSATEKKLKLALLKVRPEFKQVSHYLNKQLCIREIALLLQCSQHRVSGIKADMVECGLLPKPPSLFHNRLSDSEKTKIKDLHQLGVKIGDIGKDMGRSYSTIKGYIERQVQS